jgi:hypothetical protein
MPHKHPTSIFIKRWTMIIHRCSQPRYLWSLPITRSSSSTLHQATFINTNQHLAWSFLNDMIHFMSSRGLIGSLVATSLALHRCLGPSAPSSLLMRFTALTVRCPQASSLPFTLATRSIIYPSHVSWSSRYNHMTSCHVSYAMISSKALAILPSHFSSMASCIAHTSVHVD